MGHDPKPASLGRGRNVNGFSRLWHRLDHSSRFSLMPIGRPEKVGLFSMTRRPKTTKKTDADWLAMKIDEPSRDRERKSRLEAGDVTGDDR